MEIIEKIRTALGSRGHTDTPFGKGECCRLDRGFSPLDDYGSDEIGQMCIPDVTGPKAKAAYCLGLAAELMRRSNADATDEDGDRLLAIGGGDGRRRRCIAGALAAKGAEIPLADRRPRPKR